MKIRMQTRALFITALIALLAMSNPAQDQGKGKAHEFATKADAIVSIVGENLDGRPFAKGRGFFIGPNIIATDYAVIRDAAKVYAKTSDGRKSEARILGADSRLAVAILLVPDVWAAPLSICGSDALKFGEEVFIIESSGLVRRERARGNAIVAGKRYLKMSGQMGQECRGCPVFNGHGEVVAVAIADPAHGQSSAFAIPASYLLSLGYISVEGFYSEPSRCPPRLVESEEAKPEQGSDVRLIHRSSEALQRSAIRRVLPMYPPLAKTARVIGIVVVEMTINEAGDVVAARALRGNKYLKEAALAAARCWRFPPLTIDGPPVRVVGTVTFSFVS
jgi:TonB family protein